jgi:TatA/E family protein of Tat protein translocase
MLLFLNDIAGSEVLVILAFILMFFGSKSIPGIARSMGRTMRQIKDASNELQQEIKKSGADMKKELNLEGFLEETKSDIRQPLDQYVSDLEDAVKFEPLKTSQIPSNPTMIKPSEKAEEDKIDEVLSEKKNSSDSVD